MDQKEITLSDSFENLSKIIVEHLLRDTTAKITQTRSNKDGGYDIVVEFKDDRGTKKAFFECKLRDGNLNLRDIAANVIIAFNHGAVALVAITNHDFTQQTGEELLHFRQSTVLNIKIIVGEEVYQIVDECGITVTQEMRDYFHIKKSKRKDEFRILRLNLSENILCQIFGQASSHDSILDLPLKDLFSEKISQISSSIREGHLISVAGYLGVGKHEVILSSIKSSNKRTIFVDATFYQSKDLVVLNMLAQIWGIPTSDIFASFSRKDIDAITESVGNESNSEETVMILTALMNEEYAVRRASARQNVLLCEYVAKLLKLHSNDIGYVVYIRKLQYASKEVYDFLVYLAKYVAKYSIPCIVSYQTPEYKLQEGKKTLDALEHVDGYLSYEIKPLMIEDAQAYIAKIYPGIPAYTAKLIVARVGTRLYNLRNLLKSLLPDSAILPANSKAIFQRLGSINPNDISNQIHLILPGYKKSYAALFETLYIFECKIPIEMLPFLEVSDQDLDFLEDAGLIHCNYGFVVVQNEFIYEWIMSSYLKASTSIQLRARALLGKLNELHINYNAERIILYQILGRGRDALNLLESDLVSLTRDKQYSLLRKELNTAIDIAVTIRDPVKESEYLVSLLEIITIQKEIHSDEAKQRIQQLESCSKFSSTTKYIQYALSFFKMKRAFKLGQYVDEADSTIQQGKMYFDACINGILTDNTNDWLGRICSCYALLVKETKGNAHALCIFEEALAVFPASFELRREYYSHVACMQLYEKPLSAFSYYTKILDLFGDEAPDSAALPFHEYGDRAMSQLMACNFDFALELANDALAICQSNGVTDEEGRCLNICGCAQWCLGDLFAAETSFREATAIMCNSGYLHYAWRSQLNLLQLILQTDTYFGARNEMLKKVYADFKYLLQKKIGFLAQSKGETFRKTREYHALLALGILWSKIGEDRMGYQTICNDFDLDKHNSQFQKDIESLLSGDYSFMDSPYIHEGFIYFVG